MKVRKKIKEVVETKVVTVCTIGKEREEEEDKGNVYGVKRGIEGRVVIERWDTLEIGEEMDGWARGREGRG